MKKIIERLPYQFKEHRSFDYIIFLTEKSIILLSFFSIISFLFVVFLSLSQTHLGNAMYFMSYMVFIFCIICLMYLGLWHTRFVSRQRYKLFKKYDAFPKVERVKSLRQYVLYSFLGSLVFSMNIIFLAVNNFVLASVNNSYDKAQSVLKYSDWGYSYITLQPLIGEKWQNYILLIIPGFLFIYLIINSIQVEFTPYSDLIKQWNESRFYKDSVMNRLVQDRDTVGTASVRIGIESVYRYDVIMDAATRTLNTVFFGLIGTGKSASIAKPLIINDSENVAFYIRQFSAYVKSVRNRKNTNGLSEEEFELETKHLVEEWFTKGKAKDLTSGFYVNEPSGDLIKDAIEIIKRTGIPDEYVWLIDPPKPYTEAINILDTSVSQAAALTADLFRNFSEGDSGSGNTFFLNTEESHTRNLVTLLKYTSMIVDAPVNKRLKGTSPTLTEFFELLRNNEYIFARLELLKIILRREEREFAKEDVKYNKLYEEEFEDWKKAGKPLWRFDSNLSPKLKEEYNKRRDRYSKLDNLRSTVDYFTNSKSETKTGEVFFTFDANIEGLRAVLRRLAADDQVRRVFFSPSTKNVDTLLKYGGILLVNSAKAELGDSNSQMVGQVAEIVMQSGAYRRTPNLWPLFPFIGDEKNTILMPRDQGFLDQNRKFRTPVIHLYQNYEQAVATVGRDRADALFQSYRNAFMFQQASPASVKYISDRAGKKLFLDESQRYSKDNLLAGHDRNDTTITESITEKEQVTSADISSLEEFEYMGIMVVDNEVSDPMRITSIPHFRLPMFGDKSYKQPFNMSDPKDEEAFRIWKEEVEKYSTEHGHKTFYKEDDFLPEEWEVILSIQDPSGFISGGSLDDEINSLEERREVMKRELNEIKETGTNKVAEQVEEEVKNSSDSSQQVSLDFMDKIVIPEEETTISQNLSADESIDERIDFGF